MSQTTTSMTPPEAHQAPCAVEIESEYQSEFTFTQNSKEFTPPGHGE